MNKHQTRIKFFLLAMLTTLALTSKAQIDTSWHASVETQVTAAPPGKMPFWFRSGQFGSIPLAGPSGAVIGSVYKNYYGIEDGIDWSAGLQVRGNAGKGAYLTLIEGYVKAKASIFELSAGRTKDVVGIVDTALSSGAFSFSGNALGIPKISLAIPQYWTLPFFNKLFAVKGNYAFGFFGQTDIYAPYAYVRSAQQYFQQTTFYVRLGHDDWKLKLFGGINHNVMFGNEGIIYGPRYSLSPLQAFIYAAVGKTHHETNPHDDLLFGGKVGNHLGSVDMGAEYDLDNIKLMGYHQFIYDVGALAHLANITDGITGLSIINKEEDFTSKFNWHRILFEFIYTKNQAGQFNSKSLSGDEDYYNDYEFADGWSYKGANMGNPLITSRRYTRAGLINDPQDYMINNRVVAFHAGAQVSVNDVQLTTKLTYSFNYGTYGTSKEGHSTGPDHFPPQYGLFVPVQQFSGYVAASKTLYNGFSAGAALGVDVGGLYYNTVGLQFSVKKTF